MSSDDTYNIDSRGLAAAINARLASEGRIAKAAAFGWSCGGVAIALCLTGLGLVSALYGYSYVLSIKPAADVTAKAFAEALNRVVLKTTVAGSVSLNNPPDLKLAAGQTVKLQEGAIVKLDPASSVRVQGEIKTPQPSQRQLQTDVMNGEQLPFTSYTIFRSVAFGQGRVETGWNYDLSDTARPRSQYCSYVQNIKKGAQVRDVIAVNSSPRRPSPLHKVSFDFDGALLNCAWFSGS